MAHDQRACRVSRRSFCRVLTGTFAAPGIAIAQGSKAVRRIGLLSVGMPVMPADIEEFGRHFRELGWVDGRNLRVEWRFANGKAEALQGLAEELIRANVEVIVTKGTTATLAAKSATSSVPIVFAVGDPVQLGIVSTLARPGGNVTGYSQAKLETSAKYLSLLKEMVPRMRRVGVFEQSMNPFYRATRGQFEDSCRRLDIEPVFVEIGAADEIENAISQLPRQRVHALVLRGDSLLWEHRLEIGNAAVKHGLPTMSEIADMVSDGGILASYSPAWDEENRRIASYVDRILRGAKPADLPVEGPMKFELRINLKTARALGLTVPKELLLRADQIVQ